MKTAHRDKQKTMQRLVSAVGRIIRKHGCLAVGVNSVAKEAGVDKVLLYRYFGNLDNLMKTYVSQTDYYKTASDMVPRQLELSGKRSIPKEGGRVIIEQLRRLRASPELQEIYLWELTSDNPVTRSIADQREREGTMLLSLFAKYADFSRSDIPALSAVILAGGIHLTLRARTTRLFNGIDLETAEGWKRIEQAIETLLVATTKGAMLPKHPRSAAPRPPRSRKPDSRTKS
jgi:AcrR family transcriptional regulator